ncbi:N-acetylmuramoyl-L-alanine amidase [Streptomyces sp. TR06-5]|uniref:peptidoglycan recognition protein family protein n=1 Tax=unclassified Streptomyces TaxID=2593676 RepID=UPI0039A2E3BB
MRALLVTSLGVLSTATLMLSPVAAAAPSGAPGTAEKSGSAHPNLPHGAAARELPGRTQSLPLAPATAQETAPATGTRAGTDAAGTGDASTTPSASPGWAPALSRHSVHPFSLVGMVWDDASEQLDTEVQFRTRRAADGTWSRWRTLESDPDHAPASTAHVDGEQVQRGSSAPLWVGRSDAVQVRVPSAGSLPRGLRLELVDPGRSPADTAVSRTPAGGPREAGSGTSGDTSAAAPRAALPELTKEETTELARQEGFAPLEADTRADGGPYVGPRPGIVIRRGWGADESMREGGYAYGSDVRMAFVHHTAGSNSYSCKRAPRIIRSIYRYHVKSLGWRDIGYNFLIDKCGTIYEGRAGGVTETVRGAHTLGFNSSSMGVAVLGDFGSREPSKKATDAIAKLTAWKLGLYGVNPRGRTRVTSEGGKWHKGARVRMRTVSGHRDGFATECPGEQLYQELPSIRALAADLQGR